MARSTVSGGLTLARFLRELDADLAAPVRQAVAEGAEQVAVAVRAATPVKTGILAETVTVKIGRTGFSARVGFFGRGRNSMGHIAKIIEFGTAPHTITARGRVLAADGEFFGKTVRHPGVKARPFFWRAFRSVVKAVETRIETAVRGAVNAALRGAGSHSMAVAPPSASVPSPPAARVFRRVLHTGRNA